MAKWAVNKIMAEEGTPSDTGAKPSDWAQRIRQLTTRSGMSQSEIARRAGLNRDAFGRYHNGVTCPPSGKLIAIAKAFGVKPSEIDADRSHLDNFEAFGRQNEKTTPYRISQPASLEGGMVRLDVSCDIPVDVSLKILALLQSVTTQ